MARLLRTRRRFLVVTVVATGLSLVPPIALPDDGATSAVLVGPTSWRRPSSSRASAVNWPRFLPTEDERDR